MEYRIGVLRGDGIGPEIVGVTLDILDRVAKVYGHRFDFTDYLIGGVAYDKTGHPLPPETVSGCKASDAVLLGAVGGKKWDTLPGHLRPEAALLGIRAAMGLFANIRPARVFPALKSACPLAGHIVDRGIDLVVVRELTGGIYFGEKGRKKDAALGEQAYDVEIYSETEIARIARVAFDMARTRRNKVTSIDKANVLESSRLWREVVWRVHDAEYPDVRLENMLVDNTAMQLVKDPSQFDVVLTSNIFGDILSDEAAQISGSIGILASASLGATKCGLYEPIHGSAPDIAGQDVADPIATVLSAAMLLRSSLGLTKEADAVERAVDRVLADGWRTADIRGDAPAEKVVGCKRMGELIEKAIQ